MLALYSLGVRAYYFLILLASPFNSSARRWKEGRKNLFEKLQHFKPVKGKTIWIHCASLGEFEQARPVIEKLKKENNATILLTFFSPSGYEVRKNFPGVDMVAYLPIDFRSNAKRFLDLVKPDAAIFVKYEFWFNFIDQAQKKGIPLYLICGLFRDDHFLFRWPGRTLLPYLRSFRHLFLQDQNSFVLLKQQNFQNISVAGDTRFDRVLDIASKANDIPVAEQFSFGADVIVAGSTWEPDEDLLFRFTRLAAEKGRRFKLIIAPHHIGEHVISRIEKKFSSTSRFSAGISNEAEVLIIDNIGMLSSLYRYGKIAYVGGGFGKAVHNVLEPAAHGIPVIFGPENRKFREIQLLKKNQIGFEISDASQLYEVVDSLLSGPGKLLQLKEKINAFMKDNSGAVELIAKEISTVIH